MTVRVSGGSGKYRVFSSHWSWTIVTDGPQPSKTLLPVVMISSLCLAAGLALVVASGHADSPSVTRREPGKRTARNEFQSPHGRYRSAAVATGAEKCSKIATAIMSEHQGNAVDAAVAAVICGGVLDAHSSGIGGGAFFVVYNRTSRQAVSFNARETAPGFATQDMFVNHTTESALGGRWIGVPGEVKGLWEMHRRLGRLPWSTLLQPSIDLCLHGAVLSLAQSLAAGDASKNIANDPEFSFLFNKTCCVPSPHPEGHIIFRPKLGETLKVIAREGASAFYNGSLTEDIIQDIRDRGGNITREDLLQYHVEIGEPVTINLRDRGTILYSAPLPAGGPVMLYIMNILSGYHFSAKNSSVLTYHRMAEAMKFAFAARSELGDDDSYHISELIANMTSPEVGQMVRQMIDDDRTHNTPYYGAKFQVVDTPGTAHFSIVDSDGNAVSVTSTINLFFGSTVKGSRTGIIFNNEMDDFSTPNTTNFFGVPASPSNFIAPGKRPLSSMTPTVAVDSQSGDVRLVVGAVGGTRIITAVSLVVMRTLWFNQTVMAAVDHLRFHHQLMPPYIYVEPGFTTDVLEGLRGKGHTILNETVVGFSRDVSAIQRTWDNQLDAVSDWRKGGAPSGF